MKLLSVLATLLLLASCSGLSDEIINQYYDGQLSEIFSSIPLTNSPEWSGVATQEEIFQWLHENISYDFDDHTLHTPAEILESRKADCKGYALLYMNMAYICLGQMPDLIIEGERQVVDGGVPNHAYVRDNGVYYEPQTGEEVVYPVGYLYTFREVFR